MFGRVKVLTLQPSLGQLVVCLHGISCLGQVQMGTQSAKFFVCPKKCVKWMKQIEDALAKEHLDAGSASKLAGRLNFANQNLFRKLGRAMIKPIYAQASTRTGLISPRLREALRWWLRVLRLNITEELELLKSPERAICRLFVDAASTPAHCAAVLFIDGYVMYTDAAPSEETMAQLVARSDKQMTSLVLVTLFPCVRNA